LCVVAMKMGMIRLGIVGIDGTRIKASSSRHETASAKTLEERLGEVDEEIEKLFKEAESAEEREADLYGGEVSVSHLPGELADLKRRQERLRKALGEAKGAGKGKKVAVADPESRVLPNKEGGYAPNYVPVLATDGEKGMILEAEVIAGADEGEATVGMVDRIEEDYGRKPEKLVADSASASLGNLAGLEERGVEAYIPIPQREDREGNPARREDVRRAVEEGEWDKLPVSTRTGKLDRAGFVYDREGDCYWCPMGKRLAYVGTQDKHRGKGGGVYRKYRCECGKGCPLRERCVAAKGREERTVFREEGEELREAMEERMKREEGKRTYAQRLWISESPNAVIKAVIGLRQFLLRGLEKVRTEFLWACTAHNLKKMVGILQAQRLAESG